MEQSNQTEYLKQFLEKNKNEIAKNVDISKIKCKILSTSEEDIKEASEYIKQGKLVSFPTETVYGLGANALNPQAVKNIFLTKRRPLSDPVIVHINDKQKVNELVIFESQGQKEIFKQMTDQLWPGPLTTIIKANFNVIDKIVTAQTDYVGVRYPKAEIAQKLIQYSGLPIAAPSANLFAHVSPTKAIHVFNDFYDQDIVIIDGQSCECGVESTVLKIIDEKSINILRLGSLSESIIKNIAEKQQFEVIMNTKKQAKQGENQEAPGQALKHYSPNIESFMVVISEHNFEKDTQLQNLKKKVSDHFEILQEDTKIDLSKCLVLDFNDIALVLKDKVKIYKKMSEKTDDFVEVMNNLYNLLREAENQEGVDHILISYLKRTEQNLEKLEFFETVYDKIYRSTSGKKVIYDSSQNQLYTF